MFLKTANGEITSLKKGDTITIGRTGMIRIERGTNELFFVKDESDDTKTFCLEETTDVLALISFFEKILPYFCGVNLERKDRGTCVDFIVL